MGMHAGVAAGLVVTAFGFWWGAVAGLTLGLMAARYRRAAGWVSLPSGALAAVWALWLAAHSGGPSNSFALRLLNPAWIGAPFVWSLVLVAWGPWLLVRSHVPVAS